MQHVLFQTAAGPVRLRWTDDGVSAIELPQITDREARAVIAKAGPVAFRLFVTDAIDSSAARFYERHALVRLGDEYPCRMVLDLRPIVER